MGCEPLKSSLHNRSNKREMPPLLITIFEYIFEGDMAHFWNKKITISILRLTSAGMKLGMLSSFTPRGDDAYGVFDFSESFFATTYFLRIVIYHFMFVSHKSDALPIRFFLLYFSIYLFLPFSVFFLYLFVFPLLHLLSKSALNTYYVNGCSSIQCFHIFQSA